MIKRRSFVSAMAGVLGGYALDPERDLWVPGKKAISIPRETALPPEFAVISRAIRGPGEVMHAMYNSLYLETELDVERERVRRMRRTARIIRPQSSILRSLDSWPNSVSLVSEAHVEFR